MSQKEYLKKYLSGDINKSEKVKKKKKKDKSSTKPRYVIKFTTNHTIVCSDMKKRRNYTNIMAPLMINWNMSSERKKNGILFINGFWAIWSIKR